MKKIIALTIIAAALSGCSRVTDDSGEVAVTRVETYDSGADAASVPDDTAGGDERRDDESADHIAMSADDSDEQEDFLAAFDEANAHFDSYTVCITDSRAPGQSVTVSSEIVDGVVMTYRKYSCEEGFQGDARPDTLEMKDGMFSMTLRGDPENGGWEVSAYIVEGDGDAVLSLAGVFDYFHESWNTEAGMYIDKELSTDDTVVVVCSQPVQETVTEVVTDGTGAVSERIYYIDADTLLAERVKEIRSGGGDGDDEITEYVYSGYDDTELELPDSLTSEMGDVREIFEGYREQISGIEAAQEELTGPGETS